MKKQEWFPAFSFCGAGPRGDGLRERGFADLRARTLIKKFRDFLEKSKRSDLII